MEPTTITLDVRKDIPEGREPVRLDSGDFEVVFSPPVNADGDDDSLLS